jgi:hypothetical protein
MIIFEDDHFPRKIIMYVREWQSEESVMHWVPSTVEAALIATAVTIIGILITNQAKVSEFRQLWINALRDDAASLISHTLIIHAADTK